MATREDFRKAFGPKILEAVALVLKDEVNLLRAEVSLPERTTQNVIDAVSSKFDSLPDYPV